jgi:hypothetical protein
MQAMTEPPRANLFHAQHALRMFGGLAQLANRRSLYSIEHSGQHGLGRLPDYSKDHGRDDESDDRICKGISHPNTKRAQYHRETRVVEIGTQVSV